MKVKELILNIIAKSIFLVIGIVLFVVVLYIQKRSDKSLSFEKTDARIISSEVIMGTDSDGNIDYFPSVSYEYMAGGKQYTSTSISMFEEGDRTKQWAESVAGRYPVGKEVTAYYDPVNPQEAVLQPGIDAGIVTFMYAVSLIVIAAGILVFFLVPSPWQKQKKINERVRTMLPLTTRPSVCMQCKKENPPGINICRFCGSPDLKEITL
jgi:hypothetical protein